MPTDFENGDHNFRQRYVFHNATGVYNPETKAYIGVCFGYKPSEILRYKENKNNKLTTSFILVPVMSRENTDKWLQKIQKGQDFKYEWIENFKECSPYKRPPCSNQVVPAVQIWWPFPDNHAHCVLFGNLCKGISEHAWFCEKHLEDTTPKKAFFTKNWEAMLAMKPYIVNASPTDVYPSGHSWWSFYEVSNPTKVNFKTKTVKELLTKAQEKITFGYFWFTCLQK